MVRVLIVRRFADIVKERELWVYHYRQDPDPAMLSVSKKMEIGLDEVLHLEFEYNKSVFHLEDVLIGRIYFSLVRLKLRAMELCILRRETSTDCDTTDSEVLARYEIMDGSPGKGDTIPIRFFFSSMIGSLTPTMREVNKRFSSRYYINLVLMDGNVTKLAKSILTLTVENRRYFKQQEITLYRRLGQHV